MNDEHTTTQDGREPGVTTRAAAKQRTPAEREQWLQAYEQSGMSRKAFCEAHGLNLTTFHGWFKKRERGTALAGPCFAEVVLATREVPAIELVYPNGVRVGVQPRGRLEELAGLVRRLAGQPERDRC